MTTAHHNERDGWTWFTDPAGRIVACGTDAAAVRGAVRGSGYQIEGEAELPADRDCDTCEFGMVPGNNDPCRNCYPPKWPYWRAKR